MSHLFATTLLLTLGASSAGLLAVSSQPAQPLYSALLEVGGLGAGSGASALVSDLPQEESVDSALAAPASGAIGSDQTLGAIAADICLNLPNWQRPSEASQIKQLEAMPNYGTALQTAPLADMAKDWWGHEIFSFTTYGLSARTDPLYLSGVWTALDNTWDCYSDDQPEQMNQGALAEMWLLHHRLVSLEWQDGQYLVTVEPVGMGLQLVQFPRQESGEGLPLSIVTTTGQALAVMSGDW